LSKFKFNQILYNFTILFFRLYHIQEEAVQELKPKPINNTNMSDMEVEFAHKYEQTPITIDESETHDSDTDSILSKETAILEAGDIDESITPESQVSDSIYICEDEDGDTYYIQDVTETLCEFCGEIVKDGIAMRNHIRQNHQHLDGDCEDSNGGDTDFSCGHIMEDEVVHVNLSSNTSSDVEINKINKEEKVIEISSDSSVDMDIPVVADIVIKSKKYI